MTTSPPFVYEIIAEKAPQLRRFGMSACAIARTLGVTDKTVTVHIVAGRPGGAARGTGGAMGPP